MKWKNKGHEFDQYAEKIIAYNPQKKFYIFGAGLLGGELMPILREYGCFSAFIDNSTKKQRDKVRGVEVISLEDYLEKKDGQIIIAASPANTIVIKEQLEKHLLRHGVHFFLYDEFVNRIFPIISVYFFDKLYVSLAQIVLTERCTLKCRKCAHGCFAVDNMESKDLSLEQVYKSADSFFAKIDFIKEFVLIGGEPLLYKELTQAIEYIGNKYRKQIGMYTITTNGTIIPNQKVLEACKKHSVLLRISNYSRQIPKLKDNYQRLVDILGKYGISYILDNEDNTWMDYGFNYVNRNVAKDGIIKVFDACQTPCKEIRENRFYFCVMARSVSDNLKFYIGQNDYLDLDKLPEEDYKKELLEFTLGYSDKGYLDMCRHCNGAEAKNYPIPTAEQVKRDDT